MGKERGGRGRGAGPSSQERVCEEGGEREREEREGDHQESGAIVSLRAKRVVGAPIKSRICISSGRSVEDF